jgi:hypothetical protein
MSKTFFGVMGACFMINLVCDSNQTGIVDLNVVDTDSRPVYAGYFG